MPNDDLSRSLPLLRLAPVGAFLGGFLGGLSRLPAGGVFEAVRRVALGLPFDETTFLFFLRCRHLVVETIEEALDERFADVALEFFQALTIVFGEESDRTAFRSSATGAADAVDVVVALAREIVVHHVGDVGNVQTTSGDVGGDENPQFARLEIPQRAGAVVL